MTRLGTLLQEAREEQGLTIADLAEQTKIRPQFLQAMEEGALEILPDEAYIRPFLRTYAKALGLEAEKVMLEFDAYFMSKDDNLTAYQQRRAQQKHRRKRRFMVRLGIGFLVIAALAYIFYRFFLL